MLANTLSTMCCQQVPGMQPKSYKGGDEQDEFRDTTSPAMVSELFMGTLAGTGQYTTVSAITKNTRDEVLWRDVKLPWRRSPMWLLIRVALQLVISRSPGGCRQLYKEVMVFIMGHILNKCGTLPMDMLYAMKSKVQRRMQKLSAAVFILPPSTMSVVTRSLTQASGSVDAHWKSSQRLDARALHLSKLTSLDFERDTLVDLPALDRHIEAILSRPQASNSARYMPTSHLIHFVPRELPELPSSGFPNAHYTTCNLDRFEAWVAHHIDDWVANDVTEVACEKLHRLITRYYSLASSHYQGNPEATSVMILTVSELWVAADKVATRICPLLSQFDTGVPVAVLQKLLLPFLGQMERLSKLETYLQSRQTNSTRPTSDLFVTNDQGFANLYFDNSGAHQTLRSKIETAAPAARQAKAAELQALKADYARLDKLFDECEHQYTTRVVDTWCNSPESQANPHNHKCARCQTETVQDHLTINCEKCSYSKSRDELSIIVHEWPLPDDHATAKTVVFELDVPRWFSHWRDSWLELLERVLKGARSNIAPSPLDLLSSNDPHLTTRYFKDFGQRVSLLSQIKPFVVTHYSTKLIGALVDDSEVYVDNALKYAYYDKHSDADVGGFSFAANWDCTYSRMMLCSNFFSDPTLRQMDQNQTSPSRLKTLVPSK